MAVDPSEITAGGTATVTATLTTGPPASTALQGETVTIYWALVPDPPGGPSFAVLDSGTTDSNGQFSTTLDTTALGLAAGDHVQLYASFAGDSTYCSDESPKVNARIVAGAAGCAIPGVVNLTNPSASWTDTRAGHSGSGSFTIVICNGLASTVTFKVQGGTDGWNSFSTAVPTFGTVVQQKQKGNGATVITWSVTLVPNETESITVNETGTVPRTCGSQAFLSGEWSAAYIDPVTLLPTKEAQTDGTIDDYTQRSYITVTC